MSHWSARRGRDSAPYRSGIGMFTQQPEECLGIAQVCQQCGGLMRVQLLPGEMAGRDPEGPGANGAAAGDVVRRVADHPDALRGKIEAGMLAGAADGMRPEVVAVFGVIGKRAEGEMRPEAVK